MALICESFEDGDARGYKINLGEGKGWEYFYMDNKNKNYVCGFKSTPVSLFGVSDESEAESELRDHVKNRLEQLSKELYLEIGELPFGD